MMTPIRLGSAVSFVLLTLATFLPTPLLASTWRLVKVAQPLQQEGDFLTIGDVYYHADDWVAGEEVGLTCRPNSIGVVGEDPESEVEDLNAASVLGMTLKYAPYRAEAPVDTLKVALDASRVEKTLAARGYPCPPDTFVDATILCIRINAARSLAPPKFVRVRILGPASLQRFKGVYPVIDRQAEPYAPGRSFDACAPAKKE
jgi:hypothetical protein